VSSKRLSTGCYTARSTVAARNFFEETILVDADMVFFAKPESDAGSLKRL
jgi:hypothetical protein